MEVDPILERMYSWPGDQGPVEREGDGNPGSIRMVFGLWPGDTSEAGGLGVGRPVAWRMN